MNLAVGGRMGEVEFMRVKVVSDVSRQRGTVSICWHCRTATGAIERVVNQRMSRGGKVNADLVGAAGDEIDADQAPIAVRVAVEDPAFRPGGFSPARCRVQVSGRGKGNPPDGYIHRKPIGHVRAGDECTVDFAYTPVSEFLRKDSSCQLGTGEQNQARSSPTEAMEWRGARGFRVFFADAGEQGIPKVMAARQHGKAGRLDRGNKVVVLVEQCKRTGRVRFPPRPPVVSKPLSRVKPGFGRGRPVIQPHIAGQDTFAPCFPGRVRIAPVIELKNGFPGSVLLDSVPVCPTLIYRRVFAHMREI